MAKEIPYETYAILLYLIDQLPDEEARELRNELVETYGGYLQQLAEVQEAEQKFQVAARKVRVNASQHA